MGDDIDIEQAIQNGPKPRLCKLYKWQTSHRYPYGFFLRQDDPEIREGIYAHSIRRYPPSAAYLAGLRTHDKVWVETETVVISYS